MRREPEDYTDSPTWQFLETISKETKESGLEGTMAFIIKFMVQAGILEYAQDPPPEAGP